ncbi:hypothetical protein [Croceiramulus getboli]|nr:hypothetical protein P8624_00045 [Flavobacteriaceae bacterium YJPT1-3]WGK64959.1 hypothetical protein P8624_00055 [Flavobacteriaceae bacterium YJPT1-3]
MKFAVILIPLLFFSCGNEKSKSEKNIKDFSKAQGLITQIDTDFNYSKKFIRTYRYVYGVNSNEIFIGIERNSNLVLNQNDPIIVLVNKANLSQSFISQRGTVDKIILKELKEKAKIVD